VTNPIHQTHIQQTYKLLIAASGTGGHVFPAIATAQRLNNDQVNYQIEWLGVPDRMETQLLQNKYPLHTIKVGGFQKKLSLETLGVGLGLIRSFFQVRKILQQGKFHGVFTTGGYISAPAILAAKFLGLPVILHESNALPGKVARLFAPLCTQIGIGFPIASQHLPAGKTVMVGTPVREAFLSPQPLDLDIPADALLIVVTGGSQGAVALNQLVRQSLPAWLEAGAWVFHQTGTSDPDINTFHHPHYKEVTLYDNMAGLLQRANLVIARAGASTLTELAISHTPSILIPYPFAAENHQVLNAEVFEEVGAAVMFEQRNLTAEQLENTVLDLINNPTKLGKMRDATAKLGVPDSAKQIADLIQQTVSNSLTKSAG